MCKKCFCLTRQSTKIFTTSLQYCTLLHRILQNKKPQLVFSSLFLKLDLSSYFATNLLNTNFFTHLEFTTDVIDVPWKLPWPGWGKLGNGNPGKAPFGPKPKLPVPAVPAVPVPVSPKRLLRLTLLAPKGTKPKFCGNPELNGKAFLDWN